jgi:glycosyltransferase involved in cell wall biosynthesis
MAFLSILLPTKNRSHLVSFAIRSVLQQGFDDFEIVVCDNDDDEFATKSVVQRFDDDRIKYIRTGGLDMISNWNAALNASTGDNITVLEDKMIFYPGALLEIKKKIDESPEGVVVWNSDIFDDNHIPNRLVQFVPAGQSNITSSQVLELITKDVLKYWGWLPRGLSCSVPKRVVKNITDKYGSSYFEFASPDFVSAIKILSDVEQILFVFKAYTLVGSASMSTGNNALSGKDSALKYYSGRKTVQLTNDLVPVKSTSIVVTGIVNDFRRIANENGGSIRGYTIDNKNYVKMMTRELLVSTFVAKKVLWDKTALIQLISSEGQVFRNLFYMSSYSLRFIADQVLKKLGFDRMPQKRTTSLIDGDPLDNLELFLSGKADLGIAKGFSPTRGG